MAFSFDYVAVEPQVEGIVSTLHALGIATRMSAGFGDATPLSGARSVTAVSFEPGKVSGYTLEKIKKYLEMVTDGVFVSDGYFGFNYQFPTKDRLTTIDAQRAENAKPAQDIWSNVENILKHDLPA